MYITLQNWPTKTVRTVFKTKRIKTFVFTLCTKA